MNTKDTGNIGEHIAVLELLKRDIIVSRPLGDNSRYDLIVDYKGFLYKVQVKSTRSDGVVAEFFLSSSTAHRGGTRQYYDDIDFFLCVDITTSHVFLIPNDRKTIRIRYVQSQSRNHCSNYAADFLLELGLEKL